MHNCRATRENLIDLIFQESTPFESRRLLAEIEKCPACEAEYVALGETRATLDHSIKSALPPESFWPSYHARLSRQIKGLDHRLRKNPSPSPRRDQLRVALRNLLVMNLPVPVPVAAALLLLLLLSTLLSLRSSHPSMVPVPVAATVAETKTVEIPVIKERVVTRVIYVQKNRSRVRSTGRLQDPSAAIAASRKEAAEKTRASLAGFKPADEVKLRIIKGSYR